MKINLQFKIISVVFILAFLVFGLLSYMHFATYKNDLTASFMQRATSTAQTLDATFGREEKSNDRLLAQMYKHISVDPDILSISLQKGEEGNITTVLTTDAKRKPVAAEHLRAYYDDTLITNTDTEAQRLTVTTPVHVNGNVYGTYQIVITLENIDTTLRQELQTTLLTFTALLLFFCVILFVYVRHVIITPIAKIHQGLEDVAKGELNQHLDINTQDEIGKVATSFNHMIYDLKRAEEKAESEQAKVRHLLRLKTEFLNQVAHDLRTPLTPISGLLPLLKKSLHDGASKENKEIVQRIMNNATYLGELLRDTLNLARIDTGKVEMKKEQYNIADIINTVIYNNKSVFEEQHITVKSEIPDKLPAVFISKLHIIEVLENLISNAAKHMHVQKKELLFRASAAGDMVTVSIQDTGEGMEKNQLEKIFEEFYRVDQTAQGQSSGLGLAICRKILTRHGGKIWAESDGIGKGSTFKFMLPIKQENVLSSVAHTL